MSRFPEASVACLKRVMLTCMPHGFQANNVTTVIEETGLNGAQVYKWAENFMMRYNTEKERMDFLASDGSEKDTSVKVSRYFLTGFNMSPEFAAGFNFPKSKGKGEYKIKYMEAAFDKEAGSGEFFLEFEEKVWEYKLIECFEAQGAGQVMTSTFVNIDGNDSASDALVHVFAAQEKTNIMYSKGICSPALLIKVHAKQAIAKGSSKEFDEKTATAIKLSLEAQVVKLEVIESGVQSQSVKLEDIKHGVCNVIPDYQKEIEQLRSGLAHKTALCDKIEGQKAYKTRLINQQDIVISNLEENQKNHIKEKQAWAHKEAALLDQIDIGKAVSQAKQLVEDVKKERETMIAYVELLMSIINEERASKRARL